MQAKNAVLPFEDEKFSYIAMCPQAASFVRPAFSLVLAPPNKTKHSSTFKLCTPEGLVHRTVQSRDKAAFKRAKKTGWGDVFDD